MDRLMESDFQETVRKTEEQLFQILMEDIRREFDWAEQFGIDFMVSMEGWRMRPDRTIALLKKGEPIPGDWYETWISVFLLRNQGVLRCKENGEVPSACVNLIKLRRRDSQRILSTDETARQKSENQLAELLRDWQAKPANYQESNGYRNRMIGRAKRYGTVFHAAE